MYSAFALISMAIFSNFSKLRDPASPYLMMILNGTIFVSMYCYCQYAPQNLFIKITNEYPVVKSSILGILSSITIFSILPINIGIKVLVFVQISHLLIWLNKLQGKSKMLIYASSAIVSCWSGYIIYELSISKLTTITILKVLSTVAGLICAGIFTLILG